MLRRRFVQLFFIALVGSLVFVSTAAALRFTDDSYFPPQGTVGSSYYFAFHGDGGCGPALPYQYRVMSGALPPGLSLSSSGEVTGTPTQSGSFSFWVELSDQNPPTQAWCDPKQAQREFTITVNPGLIITTNSLPQSASTGVPYSATLDAQLVTSTNPTVGSAPPPLTWSIVSGVGNGLPPGLTLGVGVITGTPTAEGTFTFRVQAAIDATRSTFQTYTLTVRQPLNVTPSGPLAASPAPTLWEVGVPFSAKVTPSGGNGTYTIALAAGTLPAGLALAPDGTIAGTPRVAGGSQVTIRVTDGEGRTLDYQASFGVAPRLKVATKRLKLAKVGKRYTTRLTATGGLPPKVWRAAGGKLPTGVRLDRKLGVLSGVPRKAGIYLVTFEARDGLKVTATKKLRIVVRPAPKKKHG